MTNEWGFLLDENTDIVVRDFLEERGHHAAQVIDVLFVRGGDCVTGKTGP